MCKVDKKSQQKVQRCYDIIFVNVKHDFNKEGVNINSHQTI